MGELNEQTRQCMLKPACSQSASGCYVARASSYAGMSPTGPQGCLTAPNGMTNWLHYTSNMCGPGTFSVVSDAGLPNEVTTCKVCPKGKYNPVPGRDFCVHEPS